jgi:hypothetical protein
VGIQINKEEKKMETETRPDLEALLRPVEWQRRLAQAEAAIKSAEGIFTQLHLGYEVWQSHIADCARGEEFSIAITPQYPFPDKEIYIEAKDGILLMQRVDHDRRTDSNGLRISEARLDTRNINLTQTNIECTEEMYREFTERLSNAEQQTIPGKYAGL